MFDHRMFSKELTSAVLRTTSDTWEHSWFPRALRELRLARGASSLLRVDGSNCWLS